MKEQRDLFSELVPCTGPSSQEIAFRKVYYDLYSNSDSSRADRIFEDIAKLLLMKVLAERNGSRQMIQEFVEDAAVSSEALLGELSSHFPGLVEPGERFSVGDPALRSALKTLDQVDTHSCPAATLGDAFQALIGPRIRGDKGQFFTPRTLVSAMVSIARPQPADKIVDPAAGTGGFLVAAHAFRVANYGDAAFGPLIGIDKDRDLYRLGGAMAKLATSDSAHYHCANSLDLANLVGMRDHSPCDADIVLTNPPFGTRIGISETSILRQFDLGHAWVYSESDRRWHRTRHLRQVQDPQILFLELCLRLLKPGGTLGIVLPEGMFGNRQCGYIWDYVRAHGYVEALIDCPRTTFQPGTDTKTNVVFISRSRGDEDTTGSRNTAIAVARHCGHDRRGRMHDSRGRSLPDDFALLAETYPDTATGTWCRCEIADPYYLVPRFYHSAARNALARCDGEFTGATATIGDMIKRRQITVRKGHEVGAEAYGTGDIPFVRTSDITNWEVSLSPVNGVSEEVYEKYQRLQKLQPNDLLLVVDGRYKIGRTAILQAHDCRCVVQSHLRIITVNSTCPLSPYEFLYILNLPSVLEEMRNLTFIQSTLGSLGKRLESLEIPLPKRTSDWVSRVGEFENALRSRAELRDRLRGWQNSEPEL